MITGFRRTLRRPASHGWDQRLGPALRPERMGAGDNPAGQTRFRPDSLALYRAWSHSANSRIPSDISGCAVPTPRLMVMGRLGHGRASTVFRSRSATMKALSGSVSVRITANSSPPMRATISVVRQHSVRQWAISVSALSPSG